MKQIITIIAVCLLTASCTNSKAPNGTASSNAQTSDSAAPGAAGQNTTTAADGSIPAGSTVSKGRIESVRTVPVYCPLSEQLVKVNVKPGQHVTAGQVLAEHDDENLTTNLTQAQNHMEQAQFQYEEFLIGQGYKREQFASVPASVQRNAKVKCGYNIHMESLAQARRQMKKRVVKAPVSGTVTEVNIQQYDIPHGEPLCRIIDTQHLRVKFNILETELKRIKIGKQVTVTSIAYTSEHHTAKVTYISPTVDDKGMVEIKAELNDIHNLMPGMTVLVKLAS